jgi:predicted DNA binding CopG/RHH family protein
MKKFVSENWYKLMIGSSLLMASFGFMVHSVSPAMADNNNQKFNVNSNYKLVPTNADGSINVKLSDEQLDKIIPKNEEGSINIKLSEAQLNAIKPAEIQDVNINGWLEHGYSNAFYRKPLPVKCQ